MVGRLILCRHGESVWNAKNVFTGWVDVPLSPKGRAEAMKGAKALLDKGYVVDVCFTSELVRAIDTAVILLTEEDQRGRTLMGERTAVFQHVGDERFKGWDTNYGTLSILPVFRDWRLNERYYGELQGLNKDETRAKHGAEQVQIWRRSYATPPPNGESLEMTRARTIPYYDETIRPHVQAGKTVLVAAHGNSLRSIIKDLEGISDNDIPTLELGTGVPMVYEIDEHNKIVHKEWLE